jgi:hypothetical protein
VKKEERKESFKTLFDTAKSQDQRFAQNVVVEDRSMPIMSIIQNL